MTQPFKILSVDAVRKTMVVDWGFATFNHDIPLYILENPDLPKEQMLTHVGYMRPPEPANLDVPTALFELVETPQVAPEEEEEEPVVEGEVLP